MIFEKLHFSIRYICYLAISIAFVFVISDPLETVVGGEFLKIDAVVLLVAIITTLFSAMDMAWHEAIKSTVNSSKKEKIGFLGLQCSMLLVSFCIFAVTVVLLGLVSDLIK